MNRIVEKLKKKIKKNLRKSRFYAWMSKDSFVDAQRYIQDLREYLKNDKIFEEMMERIYREEGFSIPPELESLLQKIEEEKKREWPKEIL